MLLVIPEWNSAEYGQCQDYGVPSAQVHRQGAEVPL